MWMWQVAGAASVIFPLLPPGRSFNTVPRSKMHAARRPGPVFCNGVWRVHFGAVAAGSAGESRGCRWDERKAEGPVVTTGLPRPRLTRTELAEPSRSTLKLLLGRSVVRS
eukprot:gene10212-biopygen12294